MKYNFFFSFLCVTSAVFSAQEYIHGDTLSEIEEQREKAVDTIFKDFFTACKEEDKLHHESLLTEKKERLLINRYNKKLDKLADLLEKKKRKIEYICEQEVNSQKEEFTQEYGTEKIIKVRYKKTLIQDSNKKRTDMLLATLEKIYEQVVKIHNQLEQKVNTYYLVKLQNGLKEAHENAIKAIKEQQVLFDNAILTGNSLDS